MKIRRLTPRHAADYRALMLRTYAEEPEAFTSTVAEREAMPFEWWQSRVSDQPDSAQLVIGAFVEAPGATDQLVGVAGLRFAQRPRTRHKATLFGMSVLPPFRRRGIAEALIEAALEQALSRPGVHLVQLSVVESNVAAIRLYESRGFQIFGTEPQAIEMSGGFVAVVHMWREVGPTRNDSSL